MQIPERNAEKPCGISAADNIALLQQLERLQYAESFGLPPTAINGLNGRAQFALNSSKTLCVPGPFQHAHMHELTMPADCVSTFRTQGIGRSNDSKYISLRSAIQSPTHTHCCMHVGQEYNTSCYVRDQPDTPTCTTSKTSPIFPGILGLGTR